MILTVTLNPAIDVRYEIADFAVDKIFRAKANKTPGGKGLNVSRVLNILGTPVTATGFLGGANGTWIKDSLQTLNIKDYFVNTASETRNCIAVLGKGSQTEILEPGAEIQPHELEEFLSQFKSVLNKFEVICISGSLPKGLPGNIYKVLCELGKNKKIILDTSGSSLVEALSGKPFLIKPNQEELESILNKKLDSLQDLINGAKELQNLGAQNILLSLGKDGAIYLNKDNIYKVSIPKIQVLNPVGSGDSSVAGFAHGLYNNYSIEDTLKFSMACGMSNAMSNETGYVNIEIIENLIKNIIVEKIG
ncbi:1-phosphofructokinase [Cetobacterium sp. SF1]|uniref:1-phosphofructokinase n=1 Tax=unclassified Cetobacterium TaxID=2630983 RepID=UPI003CEAAAF7